MSIKTLTLASVFTFAITGAALAQTPAEAEALRAI